MENNYGYCPKCGAVGNKRERSIGGKTWCTNGHAFLSEKWDQWNKDNPDKAVAKKRGWATPYGFIDFTEPVTYEEACKEMRDMMGKFNWTTGDK